MSRRTHPSNVGRTTASWLASTSSALEAGEQDTHAGSATTTQANTYPSTRTATCGRSFYLGWSNFPDRPGRSLSTSSTTSRRLRRPAVPHGVERHAGGDPGVEGLRTSWPWAIDTSWSQVSATSRE